MHVLDTNTISALMRHDPRHVDRLAALQPEEIGAPQPVFAEIAYGIARLSSSKRKTQLQAEFERLRAAISAMTWSDAVSDVFGLTKAALERAGTRLEDFDVAIAAHALAHRATLVTSNVEQMSRISGLVVEDWSADT